MLGLEKIQHPHYFTLQYTLPPIFSNKATSFYVTRCLSCFPSSFIKRHSDPHHSPSASPLIKDTDITTEFRASTCHYCAKSVYYITFDSWFVYVQVYAGLFATSLCLSVLYLCGPHSNSSLLQQLKPWHIREELLDFNWCKLSTKHWAITYAYDFIFLKCRIEELGLLGKTDNRLAVLVVDIIYQANY